MKWLKWLSLLVMGILTITLGTVKAYAACELTVTPVGETKVNFRVTGCDTNYSYKIGIYVAGTQNLQGAAMPVAANEIEGFQTTTPDFSSGQYDIRIFRSNDLGGDVKGTTTFTIAPNVTIPPVGCNSECEPRSGYPTSCDTECPDGCKDARELPYVGSQRWYCMPPANTDPPEGPIGQVFCNSEFKPDSVPVVNNPMMYTALGCIPVEKSRFIFWLMSRLFGVVGGITLLLMIYGFIQMSLSKGDPKVVQGAKETITSAITGLVVCIFALFLLNLLGRGILKIPGF